MTDQPLRKSRGDLVIASQEPEPADDTPSISTGWLALGVTPVVAATLWVTLSYDLSTNLGDTDDALRLVIVRDLIGRRAGWFDQHMMRLQPPLVFALGRQRRQEPVKESQLAAWRRDRRRASRRSRRLGGESQGDSYAVN